MHDLSDHLPNFLIFNKFSSLPCNVEIFKRDYSKFDQQALISEIQLVDWETTFVPNDSACNMFKSFYSKISSIIKKHIPVKQLHVSRREIKLKSKPWISKALRKSIQIKNNYYKKYLKTKSTYYHTKFKLYRNKLNHLLKISKKQYYNEYFFQNIKDGKRIWKGIKQIVKFKPLTSQRLIKIVDNNLEITEPKLVANAFNNYLANIGKNLESEIPSVSNSPMEYLNNPVCNSLYIFPVTCSEIETEICRLKTGKFVGPFSIPIDILKMLKAYVSKPLEIVFNASFSTGVVPSDFKIANIVPVFKKGSQSSLCNYRPISLISVFSKLLEKLVYNRLIKFLEKNKVLFENQYGFRTKHSIDHAILYVIDKTQKAPCMLESNINAELNNIHIWLCANKLSLNVEKSNFVIFHAPQKKLEGQNFMLAINNKQLKREFCIRYLGILIDSHLNWKHHVECIVKKIRRSIGILSKLRYYVGLDILLSLYYALIYPFLTYGIIIWGNTYKTTLQPIYILQKRAMRLITFSRFDEHSSPLFKSLEIIKFLDLVTFHLAIFMYKYHNQLLPSVFNSFFTKISQIHTYNTCTRLGAKQSYYLPKARTNYGIFSIRFQGPSVWNSIDEDIKLSSLSLFKKKMKQHFIKDY